MLSSTSVFADRIVAKFNDHDNSNTPMFSVKPGWQIKYRVREDVHFAAIVRDKYGKYIDLAVNVIGPVRGMTYQVEGGKYYPEITATGHWNIEILQITK